jgi:superfamily II DNA or RNA helicase
LISGRILRPKARSRGPNKYDAFFYSLVSQDTKEAFYAAKRQQFLVEQGYGFKVYQGYHEKEDVTLMASQKEQLDLLAKVIAENIDALDKMEAEDTDVVEADQLEVLEQLAQQERAWRDVTTPTRDAGAVEIDMPQAPLLSYTRATGGMSLVRAFGAVRTDFLFIE